MKRLFILFLVAIMLAGCGRRSILKHDINVKKSIYDEDVVPPQLIVATVGFVNRMFYGVGFLLTAGAILIAFKQGAYSPQQNAALGIGFMASTLAGTLFIADALSIRKEYEKWEQST